MKKRETKALKNQIRNNIKLSIITELKQIATKAGADSKKTAKAIDKAAKQLAKKLAKNIKPTVPATQEPKALVTAVTIADAAPAKPTATKKAASTKKGAATQADQ